MTYINDFALTRENDSIDLHIKIPKFEKKVLWNSSKVYDYLLLQALQDKNATFDTFHFFRGLLKDMASQNIPFVVNTFDTSQSSSGSLK